jgi:hypothetical protein
MDKPPFDDEDLAGEALMNEILCGLETFLEDESELKHVINNEIREGYHDN